MKKSTLFVLPTVTVTVAAIFAFCAAQAIANSDFNNAICTSNQKREEKCSVTFTPQTLIFKYTSGRTARVKLRKITGVQFNDNSSRSGFLGLWRDKKFVYTVSFINVDNEKEIVWVALNDQESKDEFDQRIRSEI